MNFMNSAFNKKTHNYGISSYGLYTFFYTKNESYLRSYKQYSEQNQHSITDFHDNYTIQLYSHNADVAILLNYNKNIYAINTLNHYNTGVNYVYRRANVMSSTPIMNISYSLAFEQDSIYDTTTMINYDPENAQTYTMAMSYLSYTGYIADVSVTYVYNKSFGYNNAGTNTYYLDTYTNNYTIDRYKLFNNHQYVYGTYDVKYPTYISHSYDYPGKEVTRIQTARYATSNFDITINKNMIPIIQTIHPVTKINKTVIFNYVIDASAMNINLSSTTSDLFLVDKPEETIIDYSEQRIDLPYMHKPSNIRTHISNMLKSEDPTKDKMREVYLPFFETNRISGYDIKGNVLAFDKLTKNIEGMLGIEGGTDYTTVSNYYICQITFTLDSLTSGYMFESEFLNIYCTTSTGHRLEVKFNESNANTSITYVAGKRYTITSIYDGSMSSTSTVKDGPYLVFVDGNLINVGKYDYNANINKETKFKSINLEYFYFTEVLKSDAESVGINSVFDLVDKLEILKVSEYPENHNPLFLIKIDIVHSLSEFDSRYDTVISNDTEYEYNLITTLPTDDTISNYYTYHYDAIPLVIRFMFNVEILDQIEEIVVVPLQSTIMNHSERYTAQIYKLQYNDISNLAFESMIYEYEGFQYYIHQARTMNRTSVSLYSIEGNGTFLLIDQVINLHNMIPMNKLIGNMFIYSEIEEKVNAYVDSYNPIKTMGNGWGSYVMHTVSAWTSPGTVSNYVYNEGSIKEYTMIYEMGGITVPTSYDMILYSSSVVTISMKFGNGYGRIWVFVPNIGTMYSAEYDTGFEYSAELAQFIVYVKLDVVEIYINMQLICTFDSPFTALNSSIIVRGGSQGCSIKSQHFYESIVPLDTIRDDTITDENNMLLPWDELITSPLFDSMNIISAYDYSSWTDLSGNGRDITGAGYYGSGISIGGTNQSLLYNNNTESPNHLRNGVFKSVVFTDKIITNDILVGGEPIPVVPGVPGVSNKTNGNRVVVNGNELIFYNDNNNDFYKVISLSDFNYDVNLSELDLTDPAISVEFNPTMLSEAKHIYEVTININQILTSVNVKNDFTIALDAESMIRGYLFDEPTYILADFDDEINPIIPATTFTHTYNSITLDTAITSNLEEDNLAFKNQILSYINLESISTLIDNEQGVNATADLVTNITSTLDTDINLIVSSLTDNIAFTIVDDIIAFSVGIASDAFTSMFSTIDYVYIKNELRSFDLDLTDGDISLLEVRELTIVDCVDSLNDNNITIDINYVAKNEIDSTPVESMNHVFNIFDEFKVALEIPTLVPDVHILLDSKISAISASTVNPITNAYMPIVFRVIVTDKDYNADSLIASSINFTVNYKTNNDMYVEDFEIFDPCESLCNVGLYYTTMISTTEEFSQRDDHTTDLYVN